MEEEPEWKKREEWLWRRNNQLMIRKVSTKCVEKEWKNGVRVKKKKKNEAIRWKKSIKMKRELKNKKWLGLIKRWVVLCFLYLKKYNLRVQKEEPKLV